ncbi:MAG: adenine deaminase [Sphaerochaetaceae bacterium]
MVHLIREGFAMISRRSFEKVIAVASSRRQADLCISNAKILDVFNKEWFDGDLLIAEGYIAGFAKMGEGKAKCIVDAQGRYLVPGFIDSHVHIESSYLSPTEFSNLVLPYGTTSVVADPHEICNVCGLDGLRYMLKASEHTPLSVNLMIPSCVPATEFEHAGATLLAKDIKTMFGKDRILGLGEMMNYVGVVHGVPFVLDKIWEAKLANLPIDGHSPVISGSELDAYCASGIRTDHECATPQELKDRIRRGMYVMLRQGSACRNLLALLDGVNRANSQRCLFCTDDRQPKTTLEEGHINNNVRLAVHSGMPAIEALCIASLNSSDCYHMDDRGAIAPGRRADFLLLDDLSTFKPESVYVQGKLVAQGGKILSLSAHVEAKNVSGKMNVKDFSAKRLSLHLSSDNVRVIDIIAGGVVTGKGEAVVKVENGLWVHDPSQDILKIAVVERHHGTGNVGLALLRGYGLKHGSIATSVAHDSHNIIVVGDNDSDMETAVNDLICLGGGMTVVREGKVIDHLALPIAGLMTDLDAFSVSDKLSKLHELAHENLGVSPDIDPYMTLCFMALPVIPDYKVTDMGLFDVSQFKLVDLELPKRH